MKNYNLQKITVGTYAESQELKLKLERAALHRETVRLSSRENDLLLALLNGASIVKHEGAIQISNEIVDADRCL
jgi:hypothetical protein